MILIGSRSTALRMPQALKRNPLDFDFVGTKDEFDQWLETNKDKINITKVYELPEYNKWIIEGSTNIEWEVITTGHSSELLADLVYNDKESIETPFGYIPNSDLLFTIK